MPMFHYAHAYPNLLGKKGYVVVVVVMPMDKNI